MRWVVGVLLVVAAILKGMQLIAEPATTLVIPFGRWLVPVEVGIELSLGLLILSGLFWQRVRWLALFTYMVFAIYACYQAIGGAASCGCFGPVEVHPWWTFLLDVGIVVGLLASILRRPQIEVTWLAPHLSNHRVLVGSIIGVSVMGVALLMRNAQSRIAQSDGLLTSAGNLVILEPEMWVGKALPIADAIDLDMAQGDWIVLLHRHDCPDCLEAVPRYEELALQQPVAIVEIPPFGDVHMLTTGAAHRGRLTSDREWFIQTPVELRLKDGIVLAVKSGHGD